MAKKIRKAKVTLNGELAFPSEYVSAAEFKDKEGKPKDYTLTIQAVGKEQVQMSDGGKTAKMIIRFKETAKKLICNVTNADSIAQMYGTKAEAWVGKSVTFYPTQCMAFGDMVECLRVREKVPTPSTNGKAGEKLPASQPEAFPQDDGDPLLEGLLGDAAEPGVS